MLGQSVDAMKSQTLLSSLELHWERGRHWESDLYFQAGREEGVKVTATECALQPYEEKDLPLFILLLVDGFINISYHVALLQWFKKNDLKDLSLLII